MNMKSTKIAASVDASIVEPGVVGVSLLSPSSEAPKTGTAASSACEIWSGRLVVPSEQNFENSISFENTRDLPWQVKFKAKVDGKSFKVNSRCSFKKKGHKQRPLSDSSEVDIYPGCELNSSGPLPALAGAVYIVIDIQPVGVGTEQQGAIRQVTLGRATKIRCLPSEKLLPSMLSADLLQWYLQQAQFSPCDNNISFTSLDTLFRFKKTGYDDETSKEFQSELETRMGDMWVKGTKVMKMVQDGVRPFVKHMMHMLQAGIVNRLKRDNLLWDCSKGPILFDPDHHELKLEVAHIYANGVFVCKQPHGIQWTKLQEHCDFQVVSPSNELVVLGFVDKQIISVSQPKPDDLLPLPNGGKSELCFKVQVLDKIGELKKYFKCKLQSEPNSSFHVIASSQDPAIPSNTKPGAEFSNSGNSNNSQVCFWVVEAPTKTDEPTKTEDGKDELQVGKYQKVAITWKHNGEAGKAVTVMFEELKHGLPKNIVKDCPYQISKIDKFSFQLKLEHRTLKFDADRNLTTGPLILRNCQFKTAQSNVVKLALMHHNLGKKATVSWPSIQADKLDSDANHIAKMFCSGSGKNPEIDILKSEMNGELLFNVMDYCTAFHHESYTVVRRECSFSKQEYWYQPISPDRVFITEPLRNLDLVPFYLGSADIQKPWKLKSLSHDCTIIRNDLFHGAMRLANSKFERICNSYCSILKEVQRVSKILSVSEDVIADAERAIDDIDKCFVCEDPVSPQERKEAQTLRDQFHAETRRADMAERRADQAEHMLGRALQQLTPRLIYSLVAQSGSFLHALLSGDAKTSDELRTLFKTMYSEATKPEQFPGLGPHCDGFLWPKNFEIELKVKDGQNDGFLCPKNFEIELKVPVPDGEKKSPNTIDVTTLTGLRLVSDGLLSDNSRFADALSKSMMFIPVFTPESLQQMTEQDSTLPESNGFLFQLILARELHETSKTMTQHCSSSARNLYPCALICPIFLSKSSEIDPFSLGQEPKNFEPLNELHQCARRQLKKMGLKLIEQVPLSPQGLLDYYWAKRCHVIDVKQPDHDVNYTATATILLTKISVEIQSLYMESMAYNFPQSKELDAFLFDASMSRYAPILARHSIHSVQSFSTLDAAANCLASVAQAAAVPSHLTPAVESKLLLDAIAVARKSPLAQPINVRFDKYVDQDASVCTAAFSSSGIDIFFSKKLALVVFFVAGFIAFVIPLIGFLSFSTDDDFSCPGTPAIDARWVASQWFSTLWLLSLGLMSTSAVSYLRDPKLAKYIMFVFLVAWVIIVGVLEWYLYDLFVYQHCLGNTSNYIRDCCLYGQYDDNHPKAYFEALLASKIPMPTWYVFRCISMIVKALYLVILAIFCVTKQSFVIVYFLSVLILQGIYTVLLYLSLGAPVGPTVALWSNWYSLAALCLLKALHWYGKRISSEIAEKEADKLKPVFSNLNLKDKDFCQCFESLTRKSSAVQQHSDIARLFEVSEFVNGAFQTWIASLLAHGPRREEQGVSQLFDYPLPKSIAKLYYVDALKHLISNDWEQPNGTFIKGPIKDVNRAIAKIYRAYAGDVRRITDIVRCSVVLDSMKDINHFLMMLEKTGWVERYDFNDAKQRVAQAENPLNFGQWPVIEWRQKLQLLGLFAWAYFKLYFLGLPQVAENFARNSDSSEHCGAFEIVRVKNRFKEKSPVGGYRDVNIKVRIGFKSSPNLPSPVFVPVEKWNETGVDRVQTVVCEIQVTEHDVWLNRLPFCFPADAVSGSPEGSLRRDGDEPQCA